MRRRYGLAILVIVLFSTNIISQTPKILYIDFGPNDGTNGNITESPDVNGNFWNNVVDPFTLDVPIELIDSENEATEISLRMLSGMERNGIQNGGLLDPDAEKLDDFAIATATQDYFFTTGTGVLGFSGLDPGKGYIFTLFGSRNTTGNRSTRYLFQGLNQVADTLQTSGTGIGGGGYNGNNSQVAITVPVFSDRRGNMELSISLVEGDFAYINCMKIEEIEAAPFVFLDFGPDDGINGNITSSPDINGNYWNNVVDGSDISDSVWLVDQFNNAIGKGYLKLNSTFLTGGIGNGGLLSPENDLLSNFAIQTATQDFFYSSGSASLEIGGLDTLSGYIFSFFGSNENIQTQITEYSLDGSETINVTLQTSGENLGGAGYNGNNSSIAVSNTLYPDSDGIITLDISVNEGDFGYLGIMGIQVIRPPYIPEAICEERDPLGIVFMGSSVANGQGATNMEGYAYQYTQLLERRYGDGTGANWSVSNISVGGNNTLDVIGRWESDLLPLCGSYVVYGLSLGNEGIHEFGRPRYEQFRDNLHFLVEQSRALDIEPVIVNCYTRADFNFTDYDYIKRMNLLIHSWDLASINVLGAIDDGSGRWADGYEADPFHPNTAGHTEFYYAIVPSLFDALAAGKRRPDRISGTYLTINNPSDDRVLEYIPDGTVHPFTMTFDVRTSGSGQLGGLEHDKGFGVLEIDDATGVLNYLAAEAKDIFGTTIINDDQWHRITLTHFYARGKTFLYVDGIFQGMIDERIETGKFILGSGTGPVTDFREWFIHRSALNDREIEAMVNDSLLNSSLEVYAPLDGEGVQEAGELINLAQSLGEVNDANAYALTVGIDDNSTSETYDIQIIPNPVIDRLKIRYFLPIEADVELIITDITGKELHASIHHELDAGFQLHQLSPDALGLKDRTGLYFINLIVNGDRLVKKVIFQKI